MHNTELNIGLGPGSVDRLWQAFESATETTSAWVTPRFFNSVTTKNRRERQLAIDGRTSEQSRPELSWQKTFTSSPTRFFPRTGFTAPGHDPAIAAKHYTGRISASDRKLSKAVGELLTDDEG